MKRFLLPLLALVLTCSVSWTPALAQPAASVTRVRATHAHVNRHRAHKATRHHSPHRRAQHHRGV